MEITEAVEALGALAHPLRLEVFRILARSAPEGVPAGELAERLDVPSPTLSFHLSKLTAAGLARTTRSGRVVRYSLEVERFRELLWFVGEDCCQGRTALCCDLAERIGSRLEECDEAPPVPNVLFLCSRNAARSQMAEAILRQEAGDSVAVFSAGVLPGSVHPLTREALEEIGIDSADLKATDLGAMLGKRPYHTAIVLCDAAIEACPRLRPFAREVLYWPFPDPIEGDIDTFRSVRDRIRARIREWTGHEAPFARCAVPPASPISRKRR